jgi:AcrR family transcriptional regulator
MLIQEKRLSAITVQEITERATVNRATFYAHYVGKEELAADVLKADLRTALMHRFAEKPSLTRENLSELALGVFEFMANMSKNCPETAAELQGTVGMAIQQGLEGLLETWFADVAAPAYLFRGCRKGTVATVFSWSIYGGAYRWNRSHPRPPAKRVCREIVAILLPETNDSTPSVTL